MAPAYFTVKSKKEPKKHSKDIPVTVADDATGTAASRQKVSKAGARKAYDALLKKPEIRWPFWKSVERKVAQGLGPQLTAQIWNGNSLHSSGRASVDSLSPPPPRVGVL